MTTNETPHEREARLISEGVYKKPMSELRMDYARWWYASQEADRVADLAMNQDGEDLWDFVSSMYAIRTFGPNPLSFDPPIRKEDLT